jgi:ribonucleotide reductase beta subunit family protein with ferritin-like domain
MHVSLVSKDKQIEKFASDQLSIFWLPEEPKVEKDMQDILVNMTEPEKHGVITTLRLFSLYEVSANEYWTTRFRQMFPDKIEFLKMGSVFSMFELAVHLPFYKKLNELLYLDTEEFYQSYIRDNVLRERMEFIESIIDSRNDLLSLASFSMVEGAVLYSSFAFLKHFQSQGKNKLMNIVRGVNFSVRDESIHSVAGAYCYRLKLSESDLSETELQFLQDKIKSCAKQIFEHEARIVDMVFEKGKIEGITDVQMKNFVQSRINLCLRELGIEPIFEITYNPISSWFYSGINGFSYNDFFSSIGNSYSRNWSESEFIW